MASLGSAIITRVFGHSEAEKVFRPWWDNLEDFILYGLVMLGLVVAPTSMVTGSPLECTFCEGDLCKEMNNTGALPDPGYYSVWIKKICTFNGSVDSFTLYFPYILLLIALALVFIEKVFLALFQANNKLDKFYKLLVEKNIVEEGNNKIKVEPQSMETVQVEESFKTGENNYFVCYLARTVLELIVSTCLLTWMTCYATISSNKDIIPCKIDRYLYACSGHPQQFYKYILTNAVIFILLYIITNIYNLFWIIKPDHSRLHTILRTYRDILAKGSNFRLMKRVEELYLDNPDLRLLLNLLAANKGVAAAISAISMFDKELHKSLSVLVSTVERNLSTKSMKIGVKRPATAFLSSLEQCKDIRVKMVVSLFPTAENPANMIDVLDDTDDTVEVKFCELEEDVEYTVTAALLVDGKVACTTDHIVGITKEEHADDESNVDKKNV